MFIWNPSIRKRKKFSNPRPTSTRLEYRHIDGFGYDEFQDSYKVVCIFNTINSDQGLSNVSGKFVNGKLYWATTTAGLNAYEGGYIITFDLANEKWERWRSPAVQKEVGFRRWECWEVIILLARHIFSYAKTFDIEFSLSCPTPVAEAEYKHLIRAQQTLYIAKSNSTSLEPKLWRQDDWDKPNLQPLTQILGNISWLVNVLDGIDPDTVAKSLHKFVNYGKRNKESVVELLVTLLVKVEDFTDRSQNVARVIGKAKVIRIYKCIQRTSEYISAFMDGLIEIPTLKYQLFGRAAPFQYGSETRNIIEDGNTTTLPCTDIKKRHQSKESQKGIQSAIPSEPITSKKNGLLKVGKD
ncbi:hypothetical protein H5410_022428 [Solanum commersonii]|uniref:Uncharacterized protein n=1 Tax=Solanum commersonii TaxID=4109 RepID=A0A9J5ZDY8_SOLCO|nr:hypothetical protein H5410_022428 [Solanum commersonii]